MIYAGCLRFRQIIEGQFLSARSFARDSFTGLNQDVLLLVAGLEILGEAVLRKRALNPQTLHLGTHLGH